MISRADSLRSLRLCGEFSEINREGDMPLMKRGHFRGDLAQLLEVLVVQGEAAVHAVARSHPKGDVSEEVVVEAQKLPELL